MSKRLLIVIATADREKALAGLMYAKNAWAAAWFEDVKVVFFGPSEKLIVRDDEVANEMQKASVIGESFACKAISEKEGISEDLEKLGLTVVGVGPIVSKFINEGYVPMVW